MSEDGFAWLLARQAQEKEIQRVLGLEKEVEALYAEVARLQTENEALRAKVKRLRERCAVCKHLWIDNSGPGCRGRPRVHIFGTDDSYIAPTPEDGLCDCGKFELREVERASK